MGRDVSYIVMSSDCEECPSRDDDRWTNIYWARNDLPFMDNVRFTYHELKDEIKAYLDDDDVKGAGALMEVLRHMDQGDCAYVDSS